MSTPPAATAGATNFSGHGSSGPSHWPSPLPQQTTLPVDGPSPQTMSNSEAYPYEGPSLGEILKRKRKARAIKACFPCRHRKVRCDGNVPCSSCVARNHTELCHTPSTINPSTPYNPPSSYAAPTFQSPGDYKAPPSRYGAMASSVCSKNDIRTLTISRTPQGIPESEPIHAQFLVSPLASVFAGNSDDMDATINRLEKIEHEISALKADLIRKRGSQQSPPSTIGVGTPQLPPIRQATRDGVSDPRRMTPVTSGASPGTRFVEDTTGATIFLGSYSDPPLVLGCRRAGEGDAGSALLDQLMPKTYPFADLWRPAIRPEEICQALPTDSDVLRYVRQSFV